MESRFQFFEKDPIPAWEVNEFAQFYQNLIKLRHEHPALRAGEKGGRFEVVACEDNTLVFKRMLDNDVVTDHRTTLPSLELECGNLMIYLHMKRIFGIMTAVMLTACAGNAAFVTDSVLDADSVAGKQSRTAFVVGGDESPAPASRTR